MNRIAISIILIILGVFSFVEEGFSQSRFSKAQDSKINLSKMSISGRQMEILGIVMRVDGYVNKDLHQEFWSYYSREMIEDKNFQQEFIRVTKEFMVFAQGYQKACWKSLKMTASARAEIRVPEYFGAKERAKKAYIKFGKAFRQNISTEVLDKCEVMIRHTAESQEIATSNGALLLTVDLTEQVIAGIDKSFKRINLLLEPQWLGTPTDL